MSIEITDEMVAAFDQGVDRQTGYINRPQAEVIRAGLAAVLAMPELRQAVHDDVRRASDEELKAMGVVGYSVEWGA